MRAKDCNDLILNYMIKISKLKNDLITGEDSFDYTEKEYNDIMQDLQNQIDSVKKNINDPIILENKLNDLYFQKGELRIERLIHMKKHAKNFGKDISSFDEKLIPIIKSQNKLLSLMNY